MINYFKEIWRDRYILRSLVKSDLNLKYKKSNCGSSTTLKSLSIISVRIV